MKSEKPAQQSEEFQQLQRAVAGDADALAALLALHGPAIALSMRIGKEWQAVLDPADVMQVTYLQAFLKIADFDVDHFHSFPAWLGRIAEHNLQDAIRGFQRQKRPPPARRVQGAGDDDSSSHLLALLGVTMTTPSKHVERSERTARLNVLLDTIPEDYAQAIRLYDLEGLPIAEVAGRMGRSPGAVHMLRARGHDSLRDLLGAQSAWFSSSA